MDQPKLSRLAKNEPYRFNVQRQPNTTQPKKFGLGRVGLAGWSFSFLSLISPYLLSGSASGVG